MTSDAVIATDFATDPAPCRASADALFAASEAVPVEFLTRQSSVADSEFGGSTAAAYVASAGASASSAAALRSDLRVLSVELNQYALRMDAVQTRLELCRLAAQANKLILTPTTIERPIPRTQEQRDVFDKLVEFVQGARDGHRVADDLWLRALAAHVGWPPDQVPQQAAEAPDHPWDWRAKEPWPDWVDLGVPISFFRPPPGADRPSLDPTYRGRDTYQNTNHPDGEREGHQEPKRRDAKRPGQSEPDPLPESDDDTDVTQPEANDDERNRPGDSRAKGNTGSDDRKPDRAGAFHPPATIGTSTVAGTAVVPPIVVLPSVLRPDPEAADPADVEPGEAWTNGVLR